MPYHTYTTNPPNDHEGYIDQNMYTRSMGNFSFTLIQPYSVTEKTHSYFTNGTRI